MKADEAHTSAKRQACKILVANGKCRELVPIARHLPTLRAGPTSGFISILSFTLWVDKLRVRRSKILYSKKISLGMAEALEGFKPLPFPPPELKYNNQGLHGLIFHIRHPQTTLLLHSLKSLHYKSRRSKDNQGSLHSDKRRNRRNLLRSSNFRTGTPYRCIRAGIRKRRWATRFQAPPWELAPSSCWYH